MSSPIEIRRLSLQENLLKAGTTASGSLSKTDSIERSRLGGLVEAAGLRLLWRILTLFGSMGGRVVRQQIGSSVYTALRPRLFAGDFALFMCSENDSGH